MFRALIDSLFCYSVWHVGVCRQSIRKILMSGVLTDITWLPGHSADRYIADPFAYTQNGDVRILVEEFDFFETGKGRIGSVPWDQTSDQLVVTKTIEQAHHLSYPYLFEYENQTWCVPEEAEAGRCALYRLTDDGVWTFDRIILNNVAAVDPTVFYYRDLWWLFCTDADRDAFRTLCAYYAEKPTGPWMPHHANPVKDDLTGARPGGTPFFLDGVWYRPAQNCASTYGGSLKIQAIRSLTPDAFEEETVVELTPDKNGPYPDGLHHLCVYNDLCLIDGKRKIMDWRWLYRQHMHGRLKKQRRRKISKR